MSDDDDWGDEPVPAVRNDEWIREPLADIKEREAQQMPPWFLPLLVGAVAWISLGLWLMHRTNWPYAFGYADNCPYGFNGCEFLDIARSPALLKHPNGYSLALFAWFMSMIAVILAIVVNAARKPNGRNLGFLAVIAIGFAVLILSPQSK
jgi:hypothetical protein